MKIIASVAAALALVTSFVMSVPASAYVVVHKHVIVRHPFHHPVVRKVVVVRHHPLHHM